MIPGKKQGIRGGKTTLLIILMTALLLLPLIAYELNWAWDESTEDIKPVVAAYDTIRVEVVGPFVYNGQRGVLYFQADTTGYNEMVKGAH